MKNFCRGVGLFLLVILAVSCATAKAYEVSWPEAQSILGGKKAVVLNYGMAERALAKSGGAWIAGILTLPVGGLFYITLPEVLSNAQFNNYARRISQDVETLQNEQRPILTGSLTEAYTETFNAEVVNADYPFDSTKVTLNYFTRPNDQTKETIASICSDNDAEFVVAPVAQIITEGRGGAYTRKTDVHVSIAIFDKAGNLVATGNAQTVNAEISLNPQSQVGDLRNLFTSVGGNVSELIRSLR